MEHFKQEHSVYCLNTLNRYSFAGYDHKRAVLLYTYWYVKNVRFLRWSQPDQVQRVSNLMDFSQPATLVPLLDSFLFIFRFYYNRNLLKYHASFIFTFRYPY